jgi:hypothetical protein
VTDQYTPHPRADAIPDYLTQPANDARPRDRAMSGNPRSSGYEREASDWYVEPRRAIDRLLDTEHFVGSVWDPACGGGNIINACLDRGMHAIGSDIIQRGAATIVGDFLQMRDVLGDNIICNPPFNIAVDFVLHGLQLISGKVAVLQRTSWLEGERRYQSLFKHDRLVKSLQFRSRISMPPGGSSTPAKGGAVAFGWFCFSRDHKGPPTLGWLE